MTQNATAAEGARQTSNLSLMAAQQQANQNNLMMQEQGDMNKLVASRTSQLTSALGNSSATPYALTALSTINSSELGDQSKPQTSRNALLGN